MYHQTEKTIQALAVQYDMIQYNCMRSKADKMASII